jgi:hypothetical protein
MIKKEKSQGIFRLFRGFCQEKSCLLSTFFDILNRYNYKNKTTVKFIPYFVLAIIGLFLVGAVVFYFFSGTEEGGEYPAPLPPAQKEEIVEKEPPKEKRDEEPAEKPTDEKAIFRKAVGATDPEMCGNISSRELRDECWDAIHMALALEQTNEDQCKKIRNTNQKSYCLDQVWLLIAQLNKDYSQCEKIQSSSLLEKCNEQKSRQQILRVTSISDCEDISQEEEKRLCRDYFTSKAIEEKKEPTVEDCADLSEEDDRRRCELNITAKNAEEDFDPNQCRTLSDIEDQKECLKKVQNSLQGKQSKTYMNTGDVEGCDSLTNSDLRRHCRDRALGVRAIKDYNSLLCYEITDENLRQNCFIRSTKAANNHYYGKAQAENDSKWCELISDERVKTACISSLSPVK